MANPGEIKLRKAHGRAKELETARWWNTDGEVPLNLRLHFLQTRRDYKINRATACFICDFLGGIVSLQILQGYYAQSKARPLWLSYAALLVRCKINCQQTTLHTMPM